MNRPTFDKAVLTAWSIARTRTPDAIRKDIDKEEGKQANAVRDVASMTVEHTQKLGFKQKAEELAQGTNKNAVAILRKKYEAASKRLTELDAELIISESWRK